MAKPARPPTSQPGPVKTSRGGFLPAAFLVGVLAIFIYFHGPLRVALDGIRNHGAPSTTNGVPLPRGPYAALHEWPWPEIPMRVFADDDDPAAAIEFLEAKLKTSKPMVFRNFPHLKQWECLNKWTPRYLCENIPRLDNVLANSTHHHKFFYVDSTKQMLVDGRPEIIWNQPYQVIPEVGCSQFLEDESGAYPLYYSRGLAKMAPHLQKDVQPLSPLLRSNSYDDLKVWLSSPNVTARLHYDNSDNLFLQVYGNKRFTIFPPTEWLNLYVYPRLHPGTRQSQVDVDNVSVSDFPQFAQAVSRSVQAHLQPGDLLYLPAYWFHHVTALEMSVSVNMFLPRGYKKILTAVASHTLPLSYEPKERMHSGLYVLLKELAEEVLNRQCKLDCWRSNSQKLGKGKPSTTARDFVSEVLRVRYGIHLAKDPILPNAHELFTKPRGARKEFCAHPKDAEAVYVSDLRPVAVKIAKEFESVEPGARETLLADYMEELLSRMIGTRLVHPFLVDCFLGA